MRSISFCKSVKRTMNSKSVENGEEDYQIIIRRKDINKPKRIRSAFTTEQVQYLEEKYKKHPYIDNLNRKEVAKVLNISERSVKVWFQNRRMRAKNDNKEPDSNTPKNLSNGRLSNDLTSTNRTLLPTIMTANVKSNDSNIDKNIIIKTESLEMNKTDSFKSNEIHDKHNSKQNTSANTNLSRSASENKHRIYIPASAHTATLLAAQSQVNNPTSSQKQYLFNVPKSGISGTNYYPPYVGSGAIWRPVDMVPMVPKRTAPVLSAVQKARQTSRSACCKCSCHSRRRSSVVRMVQQPKTICPYPQFMFTAIPFQNP